MSAKFIWVRNPTAINGLDTTYVSLRGSDTNGDGTAQNPYRSLAKATTVTSNGRNIMLDDGVWNEAMVSSKIMKFWGNAYTIIMHSLNTSVISEAGGFYYLIMKGGWYWYTTFDNCIVSVSSGNIQKASNSILDVSLTAGTQESKITNCFVKKINNNNQGVLTIKNSILQAIPTQYKQNVLLINCNILDNQMPTGFRVVENCINNTMTQQTLADYFNNYNISDLLACDFTAKPGSANIGAGENGSTIGLNEGYPARATNDSNDIFAAANGATLRNVAWNATLNGYSLVHKDKVCAGYTVNTITLAADAEAIDDYYNGLFIGITAGDGAGEIHRIVDYNGATRVATIDTSWQSAISTSSVYSISGTIDSATKDFGRVIKVKRNWAFLANMQSWTDPNVSSYGMWKEFLTSPLQNNGEWMMRPCSNFRYEYSINGTEWHSSTELLAGTDTDNKTYNAAYGNASESFVAANAKTTVLRYVRYHIEIGFNIGEDAQ